MKHASNLPGWLLLAFLLALAVLVLKHRLKVPSHHLIERWRLPQVLQGFFFPLEGHFFFPKSKLNAGSL